MCARAVGPKALVGTVLLVFLLAMLKLLLLLSLVLTGITGHAVKKTHKSSVRLAFESFIITSGHLYHLREHYSGDMKTAQEHILTVNWTQL